MSIFRVSLETLERVSPHPNADRLEIASCRGMSFQFVVLKGKHKAGDRVLYFPVDALIPSEHLRTLKLEGKLSGPDRNRVKTIKLRGEISQGLVEFPELLLGSGWQAIPESELTERLGVTKYDPPPIPCQAGQLVPLPDGVSVYDIEGADRFPDIIERLRDQRVLITEKVEGSHFSLTVRVDGEVAVGQRRFAIKPIETAEHDFWKVARTQGLVDFARSLREQYQGQQVTLRGEFTGPSVQKNIYGFKEHAVYLFDILVQGRYLSAPQYLEAVSGQLHAPVLSADKTLDEWLAGRTIQEASDGQSQFAKVRREGIVIKPWQEQRDAEFGRVIIKQRGPEYLAGGDL